MNYYTNLQRWVPVSLGKVMMSGELVVPDNHADCKQLVVIHKLEELALLEKLEKLEVLVVLDKMKLGV